MRLKDFLRGGIVVWWQRILVFDEHMRIIGCLRIFDYQRVPNGKMHSCLEHGRIDIKKKPFNVRYPSGFV